ncbi:MAG: PIN domain-containing protein [Verrucomicrobia bacterium]|nr:PIN domain-containing protein [Verrucomicrobiota bacterium]MCH8528558.1 PIN domain-containing protein [Kiritimatiellia bacterium]
MSDKVFWDTNILVYVFDAAHPEKRDRARRLLDEGLRKETLCFSWQVLQEFANVALHKFQPKMPGEELQELLETVLYPCCVVYPSLGIYTKAFEIHARTQYRFYDSLIVASALEANVSTLYSEDLQDGRRIENLKIVNPFHPPASPAL